MYPQISLKYIYGIKYILTRITPAQCSWKTYRFMYTSMYIHIYMYTRMRTHTHEHTHTHTHIYLYMKYTAGKRNERRITEDKNPTITLENIWACEWMFTWLYIYTCIHGYTHAHMQNTDVYIHKRKILHRPDVFMDN